MINQPQMNQVNQMNYPGVNQMPVYSGRGRPPKHLSMNNPMQNLRQMQAPMLQNQLQQGQIPGTRNNDEVEVISVCALKYMLIPTYGMYIYS